MEMKPRAFLAPLLLLLLAAATASCPAGDAIKSLVQRRSPATPTGPAVAAPPLPQQVHDERYHVSIAFPADWTVTRREGNPILFALAPGASSFGPMANVVMENLTQRMDPYGYLEANLPAMRVSLPGLVFKLGGVEGGVQGPTAWILYTYPRGQLEIEALTYSRTSDYRAYVVTCAAPTNLFPENEALFRAIGRSLRLE